MNLFKFSHAPIADIKEVNVYSDVVRGLESLYNKNVLKLETDFKYSEFYSPSLTPGDFAAKPMIMVIGQYSTGKTTFIENLLEKPYPGMRIGPEPTTDRFVAVTYGPEEQVTPGNVAAVDKDKPFHQLSHFGNAFLQRFECASMPATILKGLTIIDTPGILSGSKQCSRGYDFEKVIAWFADHVDLILLMFDAHKLDISDEFRRCIQAVGNNDNKVRILLNKADSVSEQQLLRVYGALMWSLGKVFTCPEVVRVYPGSFWSEPLKQEACRRLLEAEASDLYSDISRLRRSSAIRKVNDFIRRAKLAKSHACLLSYLKKQLPLLGKAGKKKNVA